MMKFSRLLYFVAFLMATTALEAQSLATRVSLDYEEEKLGNVLADLSQRYQIRFTYSSYYVPVERSVTIFLTEIPLGEALDTLLVGTTVIFKPIGGQIVLKPDPEKAGELSQLDLLSDNSKLYPRPLQDDQMSRERFKLRQRIDLLEAGRPRELPGGDHFETLDLDKYRLEIEQLVEGWIEEPEIFAGHSQSRRMVQVSLLPYMGTNTHHSAEVVNNFSFNLFWGANGGVDGVEVGGLVNTIFNDVNGIQIAGLGNTVGGQVVGTQAAMLFNLAEGGVSGLQIAGLFNLAGNARAVQLAGLFNMNKEFRGFQLAGLFNLSKGRADGLQMATLFNASVDTAKTQIAGLFNTAGDVDKGQVSLLLNRGKHVRGLQLGLINVSDTISGVPLGLLNIVRKGYNRVEVAGSDILFANLALKLGARSFYNIFHVGGRWDKLNRQTGEQSQAGVYMSWGLGYGFGTAITFNSRWLMNIEALAVHINEYEQWTKKLNLLNQLRLTVDWKTAGRASLFAGPVANVMVSRLNDPDAGNYGSSLAPYTFYDQTSANGTNVKMWVGAYGGLRF